MQKLQVLDEVLAELRSLGNVSVEQLEADWRTRRAIERDLQIAVETMIDVCQRILSLSGQTPATTSGDAVARCVQLGALSDYDAYRKMVQFRNFIVHRYERVDVAVLADLVNRQLDDFDQFRQEILDYVER
ncbi:MAG: type VII toxin-antitoxin system HepT family RNase toxin [Chloroflexota bacterium]